MIQFSCPSCKYEFKVDNSAAGKSASCSWCGKPIVVPAAYSEGTITDETPDPNLKRDEARHPDDIDISIQGTQGRYGGTYQGDPVPAGGSNWPIWIAIIILLNLILIPLSGYAIVPR